MPFIVYVLKSIPNNKFYTGHTEDINKRVSEHNRGKVKSTKAYAPYKLVHTEQFVNKTDAIKRELFLKSGQGRKFIKSLNL